MYAPQQRLQHEAQPGLGDYAAVLTEGRVHLQPLGGESMEAGARIFPHTARNRGRRTTSVRRRASGTPVRQ